MTTAPAHASDPIPLPTRVTVGRRISAVMLGVLVASGAFGLFGPDVAAPVADTTLLALVLVLAAIAAAITFAPWDRRLSAQAQEWLLSSLTILPAAAALFFYHIDDPTKPDALVFLTVTYAASALTTTQRVHIATATIATALAIASAVTRGGTAAVGFTILVGAFVAVLAGLTASVMGRAMATAAQREREAAASSQALLAVVDAARTATTADEHDVLHAVAAATARLDSDLAGVYLLGNDGMLRYGATYHIPDHLVDEVFPADHGLAGLALRENRTVVTNEYGEFEPGMAQYREVELHAAIGCPIHVDGIPVGVLVAGRYGTGGYEEAAITAFELLADHAGRALTLSRAIDQDRQVLDRLRSLHALQEDFVATVSHELRTPLTVIDGLAETLQRHDERLGEGQRVELLSRLRANTGVLTTIVTTLLETARLDRGLVELEHESVDLRAVVDRCVERLQPVLDEHTVEVSLCDVHVLGDAALLERVVDNLLTNAERHTPAGTTVRIDATRSDGHHVVSITDDGPGISASDLAHITERFTRGGNHYTRTTRGLGLGLALSDQVLRLHGSRLHASSPRGQGATFRFALQCADEKVGVSPAPRG